MRPKLLFTLHRLGSSRVAARGFAVLVIAWSLCARSTEFTHGVVASVHPLATEAGLNVLKAGGNAIDAAGAVALTLGVVDGENSGLGGGCLMLLRLSSGELVAIDGRETAPAAATREMFIRNGKAQTELSQTGGLASGVPGALAAYEFAVKRYGRKKLSELLSTAADLADKGFIIDRIYARALQETATNLARYDSARAIFFHDDRLMREGERLTQPDLARTYRSIASSGSDWFYNGPFASATAEWMNKNGGLLTERDFRDYKIKLRKPIISSYRGYKLVGFPPPSSGGIHVAQILNMLERFELRRLDPASRVHVIAEAMKLAFADRAYWLGDSDFVNVPLGLTDKDYARSLSEKIALTRAVEVRSHGTPPDTVAGKKHTTHFCVADAAGNWVACTTTVNTSFGSKVVIPGTGVVMNNQMDDFSIEPGVTNAFGLLGAEANAIAPGKRPLSSMSPTLVLKGDQPIIALGAAGGPRIISQVVLELVDMLDLGMSPAQAVAAPRIHHQWFPNRLMVEPSVPKSVQEQLRLRGHALETDNSMGVSQIISWSRGEFLGAADPRAAGTAEGW